MAYQITFTHAAAKALRSLPRKTAERIGAAVARLADDPHPPGAEKLKGEADLHRIRVGDYRVVYTVEHDVVLVTVVRIGHRREVYRR
jgi:mRNA interferase RelE/StbE